MLVNRSGLSAAAVVDALPEPVSQEGRVARTLRRVGVHAVHLASNVLGDDYVGRSARVALLRAAGAEIGRDVALGGGTYVSRPGRLVIADSSYMGRNCYLDLEGQLVVGSHVSVGHGVSFITTKHAMGPSELRCGAFSSAAITIGDGAWIGANVTILPGVSIGAGAVVAAASVVTVDVADNVLVGGRRARAIRDLD